MIKESVTVDEALAVLNEAVAYDRDAMERLVNRRVRCNEFLVNHPTLQVSAYPEQENEYEVGLLGVLNGLFGISETGWGTISAFYDLECPSGCQAAFEELGEENSKEYEDIVIEIDSRSEGAG